MGWDSSARWSSKRDATDDVTRRLLESGHTVKGFASTSQGAYWVLIPKDQTKALIYVAMIQRNKGQIWTKTMPETMGPFLTDCPKDLMDIADPPANEHAQAFRKGCEDFRLPVKKIAIGDMVELYGKTYKVVRKFKRSYIMLEEKSRREYRMTQFQQRKCKIINNQNEEKENETKNNASPA